MRNLKLLILYIALMMFSGCFNTDDHDHEEHEAPAIAVTQWTDKMELFMEYEIAAKNKPVKFIIHLTTISDFKPVLEGELLLRFKNAAGSPVEIKTNQLLRDGIFAPVNSFENAGKYQFTLHYKGAKIEESFDIGDFIVYQNSSDIPDEEEENGEKISFLKEQQWKTDFRSEPVKRMNIHSSMIVMGEVLPRQQSYVELASPVDGVLEVTANKTMATPGTWINKGSKVATLKPPVDAANSWVEWFLEFERIKKEYERAEKLYQKNSISIDKFENIKYDYLIQKAKYGAILSGDGDQNIEFNVQENTLTVKSPIAGVVSHIDVQLGQKVNAGQQLMTIVDPSKIWLKLHLFEKDFYNIDSLQGAALIIPGKEGLLTYDKNSFTLLNKGSVIDPNTRAIPVLVELANPSGLLKIGQTVQVELYTSEHKEHLSVPKQAIFDDDGKPILFVHSEGESFEKRNIVTGGSNNGWVAILEGVADGERVVTQGGYQVKLATSSTVIGHPHTH